MRILLILPRTFHILPPKPSYLPVGIASLAAVLEQAGHQVAVFDRSGIQARIGLDRSAVDRRMLARVRDFQPDLVGFKSISPLIHDTVHCARLLRPLCPGPMIAGGPHATALPELTLKKIPELDLVVTGEGEEPLRRLAAGDDPRNIPGVTWRDASGEIAGRPPEQLAELDRLPFPRFDCFDLEHYLSRSLYPLRGHLLRSLSLLTSRGCFRLCDFCCESLTYGKGVRFHSPHYVLEMVDWARRTTTIDGIYFLDNDFLADPARAFRICDLFERRGIHRKLQWGIQARAERIEPELVRRLKSAGCVMIEIGIESPLQTQLDAVAKHTTAAQNQRAIECCKQHGIAVHAYLIVGFPGETLDQLQAKLAWLKRVRPTSFSFSPLLLLPGTRLYRNRGEAFFERQDWTEEAVTDYYQETSLAAFTAAERNRWLRRQVTPYQAFMRRWHLLRRHNPIHWPFIVQAEKDSLRQMIVTGIGRLRGICTGSGSG